MIKMHIQIKKERSNHELFCINKYKNNTNEFNFVYDGFNKL